MKRVLHVLGGLNRGGIESFIMNLYRTIDRDSIQFDFLVFKEGGDYYNEIISLGGTIFTLPPRNAGIVQYYKGIKAFFRQHSGDYVAVHLHAATLSSVFVLTESKRNGIPIRIIHSHSSTVKTSRLHYISHYFNKRRLHKYATHYFACSEKAAIWFYSNTKVWDDVKYIKNGIISKLFEYNPTTRAEVRNTLCIDKNDIVLCHVGSFTKVKNHVFLLKVFCDFHKKNPQSKLMLIGEGPLKQDIESIADIYSVRDHVLFMGNRADVYKLLQAADVFVMPSLFEGLPVSLVEAQAAGLPVVCSDTISSDTKLIDSFTQLSLELPISEWSSVILYSASQKRENRRDTIIENGYDIQTTASFLVNIYSGHS